MIRRRGGKLNWTPPKELPDLRGADMIAFDTETRDKGLSEGLGPGGYRGAGHILGISYAVETPFKASGYISLRHPDTDNFDVDRVKEWVGDMFSSEIPKVGANIKYDLEWLRGEGFPEVGGPLYDVQNAEPLIDESRRTYSLMSLSERYLEEKYWKAVSTLDDEVKFYLKDFKGKAIEHIWRVPAALVGAYAEMDAIATLKVFKKQIPILEKEGLWTVFDVETRLVPMLLDMRFKGVRIHTSKLDEVRDTVEKRFKTVQRRLNKVAGYSVNVRSGDSLAPALDELGVKYRLTKKTKKPSITQDWLTSNNSVPFIRSVLEARQLRTLRDTFIDGAILTNIHKGRLHCQFNQLKSDDYGTVSGRFSSSGPNLQQVPSREGKGVELIRPLFVPSPGCRWWKIDWSQIEYRLFVHFAYAMGLKGAAKAHDQYWEDPTTDYHQWVADHLGIPRYQAKAVNFGFIYGMGVGKLAQSLGLTNAEAKPIFDRYHKDVPFAKLLSTKATGLASSRGYVKTILGRRSRFNLYEPPNNFGDVRLPALPKKEAIEAYGSVRRAGTYRAPNRVIQGSAADLMKYAMVKTYEAGCYDVLGVPGLTVHDELDGDLPRGPAAKEALTEVVHIMETCMEDRLSIPVLADVEVGSNWYDVKDFKIKRHWSQAS